MRSPRLCLKDVAAELVRVETEWSRALASNDVEAMSRYMAEDWVLIAPDGNAISKPNFLALVRSGDLVHDKMELSEVNARVYGDAAVVTAKAWSGGLFQGKRFLELERSSDVFVKKESRWQCVLTHLSKLVSP